MNKLLLDTAFTQDELTQESLASLLLKAGYPKKEMCRKKSSFSVEITPLTHLVIHMWCEANKCSNGITRFLVFDKAKGRLMFRIKECCR